MQRSPAHLTFNLSFLGTYHKVSTPTSSNDVQARLDSSAAISWNQDEQLKKRRQGDASFSYEKTTQCRAGVAICRLGKSKS